MDEDRHSEKNERRLPLIVDALPVDWIEVSNLVPAEPTRTNAAMSCGTQAHLVLSACRMRMKKEAHIVCLPFVCLEG